MPPRKIDPAALAAWTGTDAAFALQVGCTPQAVSLARQRATQAAPIPVRKPLGRRVQSAVLAEAARRGVSVVQVLEECRVALVPMPAEGTGQALALVGQWPGDESDEVLAKAMKDGAQ
jgi:hypothetical protein